MIERVVAMSVCLCLCRGTAGVSRMLSPLSAGFSQASRLHTQIPQYNSNRTSVVRCGRHKYERLYPVTLVQPDGATVTIRYKEPRHILMVSAKSALLFSQLGIWGGGHGTNKYWYKTTVKIKAAEILLFLKLVSRSYCCHYHNWW